MARNGQTFSDSEQKRILKKNKYMNGPANCPVERKAKRIWQVPLLFLAALARMLAKLQLPVSIWHKDPVGVIFQMTIRNSSCQIIRVHQHWRALLLFANARAFAWMVV